MVKHARIRPFDVSDEDACYEICLRTAANGSDATSLHTDPRIVGDVWVGPYLERWPEYAFVVEDDEGVGGYIVGTPDTDAHDEWTENSWLPPLRKRYPPGTFQAGTADAACVELIHTPLRTPNQIIATHPAHLHIDQLPRLQRRGFGRQLVDTLLAACRSGGANAIHLGCSPDNADAIAFYRRLGFSDLMGGFLWGRSTEILELGD